MIGVLGKETAQFVGEAYEHQDREREVKHVAEDDGEEAPTAKGRRICE